MYPIYRLDDSLDAGGAVTTWLVEIVKVMPAASMDADSLQLLRMVNHAV